MTVDDGSGVPHWSIVRAWRVAPSLSCQASQLGGHAAGEGARGEGDCGVRSGQQSPARPPAALTALVADFSAPPRARLVIGRGRAISKTLAPRLAGDVFPMTEVPALQSLSSACGQCGGRHSRAASVLETSRQSATATYPPTPWLPSDT
jgi:hypothetical protein